MTEARTDQKTDHQKTQGEASEDRDLAPEAHNMEQDDREAQAQTVAEDARGMTSTDATASESERTPGEGQQPGSTPDVVDHMKQMTTDGRLDFGAYRGERSDDDEDDSIGPQGREDDFPRGAE